MKIRISKSMKAVLELDKKTNEAFRRKDKRNVARFRKFVRTGK